MNSLERGHHQEYVKILHDYNTVNYRISERLNDIYNGSFVIAENQNILVKNQNFIVNMIHYINFTLILITIILLLINYYIEKIEKKLKCDEDLKNNILYC